MSYWDTITGSDRWKRPLNDPNYLAPPPPNFSPVGGGSAYVPPPSAPPPPNFSPVGGGSAYVPPPSASRRRGSSSGGSSSSTPVTSSPGVVVSTPEPVQPRFKAPVSYPTEFPVYGPPEPEKPPQNVVSGVEPKQGLDRTAQNLRIASQQQIRKGNTLAGNTLGYVSGFVQAGSDTLRFGKQLATKPVATVRGTAQGVWTLATDREVRSRAVEDFSYRIKTEPGYVAGGISFDAIPLTVPPAVSKSRQAKVASRALDAAPTPNPIARGVTIGADTITDYDFLNPADRRVTGFQQSFPDGAVRTELRVSDRTYRIVDGQPTRLFSFDDAGKLKSELLFDRSVQTFDLKGRPISSTQSLATTPTPVTVRDTSVDRSINWVTESLPEKRSAAFATSTAQTRFTSEADGLFVRGATATRQDTTTLANWREVRAVKQTDGLPPRVFLDDTPPQFTFKNVREPADKILVARDGDTLRVAKIAQSRAYTEGVVSTRGTFDVFTQAPPASRRASTPIYATQEAYVWGPRNIEAFDGPVVVLDRNSARIMGDSGSVTVPRNVGVAFGDLTPGAQTFDLLQPNFGRKTTPQPASAPLPSSSSPVSGSLQSAASTPQSSSLLLQTPDAPRPGSFRSGFGRGLGTPTVAIKDVPGFQSAVDATPTVRGFQGLSPSSVPEWPLRPAATLTLVPVTDSPLDTSRLVGLNTGVTSSFVPSIDRRVNLESVQNPKTEVTPFIAVESKPAVENRVWTGGGTRSTTRMVPLQTTTPVQVQKPVLTPIQQNQIGRTPAFRTPAPRIGGGLPVPPPIGFLPSFSGFKPKTPAFGGGFRVFVRRGGEFKPVGPVLTRSEALEFGAFKVDSTPAASFKIKPVSGSPTGSFAGRGFFSFFKPSKRESGVFVEPASRRIRTPGEKRGITLKGIQSQRLTTRRVFK